MRIRMRTTSADDRGCRNAGSEYDVPDDEAKDLIKRRYAEPVDGRETAAAAAPETATPPKTRPPRTKGKRTTKKRTTKKRKTKSRR